MKKYPLILLILLFGITLIGLNSCNDDNCSLTTTSAATFDLLSSNSHSSIALTEAVTITASTTADVIVRDTLPDGSVVDKVVKDSILNDTIYNAEKKLSKLKIPLSYSTKTTITIQYTELLKDEIEIKHRPIPFVSDINCGVLMFYQIEDIKYTTNALDSITIANPKVTNEETVNFNMYYTIAE
ncbi:DUF6452 family protein [Phocaeicola oris]|uniref:DUF6452 family protein n=1 Tax=Phocaeicola oris TaxID=2896850 RepID=UPI00234EF1D6|nr:DUF6452 family protein [Phocaeicola oris]MCE2615656.1 DUF6452 family protein [Phocaeicola oris]